MPRGFKWRAQFIEKKITKKAIGRMIMGIRGELEESRMEIRSERKGIMVRKVRQGVERWSIIGVYVRENKDKR